jgi:riboflavin kinase/FMN adenylyltransferase
MHFIRAANELKSGGRKICLAIGFFDGAHLGHQQIIRQTIADASRFDGLSLVVTFDRHPTHIVAPQRVSPLIYSLPRRLQAIESLGAEALLLIHFDQAFSEKSGEEFIRGLAHDLGGLQSICVGSNFVFGHQRTGNINLLNSLGAELKFTVHGLTSVSLGGKVVSSTRIREAIRAGDFDVAGQLLGRAYSLSGTVIKGDQLGRQLGFRTANLEVAGLVLPPAGVYTAHAIVGGNSYRAAVNIGSRPSVSKPTPEIRVEAHLLNFDQDIYGAELELVFRDKLRDEQKFPSLEALKLQIARDVADAAAEC